MKRKLTDRIIGKLCEYRGFRIAVWLGFAAVILYGMISMKFGGEALLSEKQSTTAAPSSTMQESRSQKQSLEKAQTYVVEKVVDGDTIKIRAGKKIKTVRLIGIDTPESVHPNKAKNVPFGKVSAAFTKRQLYHKKVKLIYDVQKKDRYGRLLAYIYRGDQFFNLILLQKGYARTMPIPPNMQYANMFDRAEQKAREQQLGFWQVGYKSAFR